MSGDSADGVREPNPRASVDVRRRLVAESLRVGNPANNARDLPAQADPLRECQIELDVDQIKPYEGNPRHSNNPRFADIKESIRACGIRNPITVTRRPGEAHFIVESGGNTRMLAVQQLWAETGNARFGRLSVLFRPWRSESHVLIAHLIENEQRGDMTFWDKANGIAALKTQLEAEQGRELTVRQLEADLKQFGIAVSHTTLNYYRFATERLRVLGEVVTDLSGGDVTKIQPQLNLIKHYAQAHVSVDEPVLYEQVLEPVFRRHAAAYARTRDFRPDVLCRDCEEALAQHLNQPVALCRRGIAALARPATATVSSLQDADDRQNHGATDETPDRDQREPADRPAVKGVYKDSASPEDAAVNPLYSESAACASPVVGTLASESAESRADISGSVVVPSIAGHSGADDQQVRAEVERFARLAGIDACLSPEKAPLGYTVSNLPLEGGRTVPRLRRQAWWLLCLLCGTQDDGKPDVTHEGDSVRAVHAATAGAGFGEELVIDATFVFWLLDTADEAASCFRQIITLLRAGGVSPALERMPLGCAASRAECD